MHFRAKGFAFSLRIMLCAMFNTLWRINQIYCLKGVIRTTRSQKYVQCTTETKSRVPWGKVSQAWHTVTSPTISSGPPSSWITRVCQYPQPEKLMVRPGIEPGSPAYMADALCPDELWLMARGPEFFFCPTPRFLSANLSNEARMLFCHSCVRYLLEKVFISLVTDQNVPFVRVRQDFFALAIICPIFSLI